MLNQTAQPTGEAFRLMETIGQDLIGSMLNSEHKELVWVDVEGAPSLIPQDAPDDITISMPGESQDHGMQVPRNIAALLISITALEYAYMSFWGHKSAISNQVLALKLARIKILEAIAPKAIASDVMAFIS